MITYYNDVMVMTMSERCSGCTMNKNLLGVSLLIKINLIDRLFVNYRYFQNISVIIMFISRCENATEFFNFLRRKPKNFENKNKKKNTEQNFSTIANILLIIQYFYIIYTNSREFSTIYNPSIKRKIKIDYMNQTKHFIPPEYPNVPNIRGA